MKFNKEQTKKFVDAWNKANDLPLTEDTQMGNMRYVSPGVVTWNEYDAPSIQLSEFISIFEEIGAI